MVGHECETRVLFRRTVWNGVVNEKLIGGKTVNRPIGAALSGEPTKGVAERFEEKRERSARREPGE